MDDFEVYVKSNKDQLNEPSLDKDLLWQKIEGQLNDNSTAVVSFGQPWLKIAALFVLFIGAGFLAVHFMSANSFNHSNAKTAEIVEIKAHYNHLIDVKLVQIKSNQNISRVEKTAFIKAIEDLNTEANNLQVELKNQVNNTTVIEAMVQNYKQQMGLLERLLQRNEKIKNKNHEQSIII